MVEHKVAHLVESWENILVDWRGHEKVFQTVASLVDKMEVQKVDLLADGMGDGMDALLAGLKGDVSVAK